MTATMTVKDSEAQKAQEKVLAKKYKLGPLAHIFKLVWGAIFTHIGVLFIVALYYVVFQVHYGHIGHTPITLKNIWDNGVSNSHLRHLIRNVAEGVLGAWLAKAIMWNEFTKSHLHAGKVFDLIQNRLKFLPIYISAILTTAIVFALSFWAGVTILHHLSVHTTSHSVTGSLWNRTQTMWNSNWDEKALGFICAFFASRPMHVIFSDVQGYFAGRRAAMHRKPPFFYPKVFKNRYKYMVANPETNKHYSTNVSIFMSLLVLLILAGAGYGYYILTYIA